MLDQTLVIVTSDHGENIGDHGMIDHFNSMFDSTIRVPLICRFPSRFAPDVRVDDPVSLVDLAPTVLDVCGVLESGDVMLSRSLCDREARVPDSVFAENGRPINAVRLLQRFPDFDVSTIDHEMRAVRTGRHKLVWKVGKAAELYDLVEDPQEAMDIGGIDRELRNTLLLTLREWVAGLDTSLRPGAFSSRDRENLERLRALGYVE